MAYSVSDFRRDIRRPYAWPGGYPRYFLCGDGLPLAFKTVQAERWIRREILESLARGTRSDQWRIVACEINWEDGELYCSHTGERIESAYAEPENA